MIKNYARDHARLMSRFQAVMKGFWQPNYVRLIISKEMQFLIILSLKYVEWRLKQKYLQKIVRFEIFA